MDALQKIYSFIRLGYFADYQYNEYPINIEHVIPLRAGSVNEKDLVEQAHAAWRDAIGINFMSGRSHVVPLSGGLDSRAILAELVNWVECNNITTYTFGTPGSYDYEIGARVAKAFGLNHHAVSLKNYPYTIQELLETSYAVRHQTFLFHTPPLHWLQSNVAGKVIWSGFVGDAIGGGHWHSAGEPLGLVRKHYVDKDAFVKSQQSVDNMDDSVLYEHICPYENSEEKLSYHEQILYNERVKKLTAPHVLLRGYEYKTPFINNSFMNFMLGLPAYYRINQYLYRQMLKMCYPAWFALPTKNNHGYNLFCNPAALFLKRVNHYIRKKVLQGKAYFDPTVNYVDFAGEIRSNASLQAVIRETISSLDTRRFERLIRFEPLLRAHIDGQANHSTMLLIASSLEIHLRAGMSL